MRQKFTMQEKKLQIEFQNLKKPLRCLSPTFHSLRCNESTCNAEDPGSIPGPGRSPGEGNGNPLQYSCLENSMDRGAWLQFMGSQRVGHG